MSEISGRFVVPVRPTYKRTVGIVHDSSRTGKTLYVEPTQARTEQQTGEKSCVKACVLLARKSEQCCIFRAHYRAASPGVRS